jgi:putative phosphoribosyl transferase
MGAIASGGIIVLNREVVESLKIPERIIDLVVKAETRELERRERAYRGDRPPIDVTDRTVILVDDGLATGASMHAAVTALRQRDPSASWSPCRSRRRRPAERSAGKWTILCAPPHPSSSRAVGLWYQNFSQTSDEEVRKLLEQAAR